MRRDLRPQRPRRPQPRRLERRRSELGRGRAQVVGESHALVGDVGDPGGGAADPPGRRRSRRARPRLRHRVTGAPGSRASALARSGSTCPRSSWPRRASSRPSTAIEFPLIHASAEAPPLPDGSFDLVFSEYGAAIWCDPYVVDPAGASPPAARRAAHLPRQLAAGGLCSPLSEEPTGETLVRPQRGLGAIEWPDDDGIDFHQPHGERIKLLRDTGFEIEALHELYAPDGDPDEVRYFMRRGWAQKWPCEAVWVARRTDR